MGTKAPTQVEDGNYRLMIDNPGAPPCSLTTNQSQGPAALTPNFAYKNSTPKPTGEFGFLSTIHTFPLLGPAKKLSLPQTPVFWFVWSPCASGT